MPVPPERAAPVGSVSSPLRRTRLCAVGGKLAPGEMPREAVG